MSLYVLTGHSNLAPALQYQPGGHSDTLSSTVFSTVTSAVDTSSTVAFSRLDKVEAERF